MSHYTVIVTNTQLTPVEEQLAPYDENLVLPRYVLHTREQLIERGRKEIEGWAPLYAEYHSDPEAYRAKVTNPAHMTALLEIYPKQRAWTDQEVWEHETRWYEPEDIGPEGEVYTTGNGENGNWDWYQVGGRWSGYFRLKHGGESVDIARLAFIDWEGMKRERAEEAAQTWDAHSRDTNSSFIYGIREGMTREGFIEEHSGIAPFAVLHEGNWIERGKMGWFALVSDELPAEEWETAFERLLRLLPPHTELTLVDCHI